MHTDAFLDHDILSGAKLIDKSVDDGSGSDSDFFKKKYESKKSDISLKESENSIMW